MAQARTDEITDRLARRIEDYVLSWGQNRFRFERQWYDNLFFYEGYHFRYVSRNTGQIVDLAPRDSIYNPHRVIPKASRQVDGITNLITQNNPMWVVYPEKVDTSSLDLSTPEGIQILAQELQKNAMISRRVGHYLENVWYDQDLRIKTVEAVIAALKMPVSFFEVSYNTEKNCPEIEVWDAFDIYIPPGIGDLEQTRVLVKAVSRTLEEVKSNDNYQNTEDLVSDAKRFPSDIKNSYFASKFGQEMAPDEAIQPIILKEAWIKEILSLEETEDHMAMDAIKEKYPFLRKKKAGETVIRVVTVAQGKRLRDEYVDLDEFPFVGVKLVPGQFYKPAWIERFIPQNKSLDMIASRIEKFIHTMTTGKYLVRKGEGINTITNESGEIMEYTSTPPEQQQLVAIPNHVFLYMNDLEKYIDEQGISSASMGKIPKGNRAYRTVESMKQSDMQNIGMTVTLLEKALTELAEKIIDMCDRYMDKPQTIMRLKQDMPDYFDVIGNRSAKKNPTALPIKQEYKVRVSIESGMSYTEEGKRQLLIQLAQMGKIPDQFLLEKLLIGPAADILDQLKVQNQVKPIEQHPEFQQLPNPLKQAILKDRLTNKIATGEADASGGGGGGGKEKKLDPGAVKFGG